MVGSTALRTELGDDAADVVRAQHEQVLRSAVEDHGGTVVKVMGDGLMAVFDGAAAGVAAGVALQQAVRRQAQRTALPIQIRVGLAAGDVTWDADDYHGTPVVEAARLEPKAAPGTILASELVRMLAGSRTDVEFTSAGPFELKGLPGPVNAYEVGWPSEPASRRPLPSALEAGDEMPFTGRDEERRQLGELWRATESGGFRLAIVSGEAGIGKTRLASELARGVDDATVLAGRCDDELDVPCQPFVEALRHFLHHCPPAYLRDELGTEARELVRLAPELADRFPDLVPAPATDAETARYRMFEAVAAWLVAASGPEPILLVVDDLQWGSKTTLLLVRHLARSTAPMRVLLLATWRDSDAAPNGSLETLSGDLATTGRMTRIRLEGLERPDVERLVEQVLEHSGSDPTAVVGGPGELGSALYRTSEGNPFFLQELTRDVLDLGVGTLGVDDVEALLRFGVPESVRDVVLRRVGRLDDRTGRVLAAAAVCGRQFEVAVLERVLDLGGDEVIDSLERAGAARLVHESGRAVGSFEFDHGLVRDVLYSDLGVTRRARLHARMAAALETVHADDPDAWVGAIASHLLDAGSLVDQARAVGFLMRAGEVALRGLSYEQAVASFERALTVVESKDPLDTGQQLAALLALGDARFRTLDFDGSKKVFSQAAELARAEMRSEGLARAACGLARAAQPGAPDPALGRLLDEAIGLQPDTDTHLRAQLLAVRAAHSLQNTSEGPREDLVVAAVAMATRLGDPGELAFVVGVSVIATFAPDLLEQRLAYIELQLESARGSGHLEAECEAHGWRATSMIEAGQFDRVREDVDAMARIAEQLGQPWYRAMAQQRRAMVAQLSSDYGTAETLAESSLAAAPQQQLAVLAGYAGLTWAVRRDQGRLAEIEPALAAFLTMTPGVPAWQATVAVTALELGRSDDARAALDTLVEHGLDAVPEDWLWLATMVLTSEVAAAVGAPDLVADLLGRLRPYERRGVPVAIGVGYLGTVSRVLGILAHRLGDDDAAIRDLEEAVAIESRLGAPAYEARARLALGRVHLQRGGPGDAERASALLHEANTIAERHGVAGVARQATDLGPGAPT